MHIVVIITGFVLSLLPAAPACSHSQACPAACRHAEPSDVNDLEVVLQNLQEKAERLEAFQAKLDYVVRQPLLESQQRRQGHLYYAKRDGRSTLRINFRTLQQDDEPAQDYREQFLFDGVWLWHIDYQTERVERRQMTEPNEPVDAFALASRHVPVVGFSRVEDLHEQFDIRLISEPNSSEYQHLRLETRPDSVYKDDYTTIDFWVDEKLGLPTRIVAVTTEEDVHEIALLEPEINGLIDPQVFRVDVPRGFSVEVIPLDRTVPK